MACVRISVAPQKTMFVRQLAVSIAFRIMVSSSARVLQDYGNAWQPERRKYPKLANVSAMLATDIQGFCTLRNCAPDA